MKEMYWLSEFSILKFSEPQTLEEAKRLLCLVYVF